MPTLLPASVITGDGLRLHLQHWPAFEPARGTVLLVHGLGEHVGRHEQLALRLRSWGFHVTGYDQRGHGLSEGRRGGLPADDTLLLDLRAVLDAVLASLPAPLVLFGHSMGGVLAARYVAAGIGYPPPWWREVDGLVLSSPALDAGLAPWRRGLVACLRRLLPDLAVGNGLEPAWVSRDPAVVQAYLDDPLVHDRITPRLAGFIVDAGRLVRRSAADWNCPTLLLWAGADRCVAPAGSAAFLALAPRALVQGRDFPGLAHEIFHEPEHQRVVDTLRLWMSRYPRL